jgi:hypothetical protein
MSVVGNRKGVAAVGQVSLLAVLAKGARGTVVALAVAEDAVGASRVKLREERLETSAIAIA